MNATRTYSGSIQSVISTCQTGHRSFGKSLAASHGGRGEPESPEQQVQGLVISGSRVDWLPGYQVADAPPAPGGAWVKFFSRSSRRATAKCVVGDNYENFFL